jgi:hypothetical protein
MNKYFLLILILLLGISLPLIFHKLYSVNNNNLMKEGFNTSPSLALGKFPNTEDDVLLQDTFPISGLNGVSNKQSSDLWWYQYKPLVGSYEQITNNLRYRNNPDDGLCTSTEFCGALYKDHQAQTNIAQVLPPVKDGKAARVGYYNTPINFFPYRNYGNILY